MQPPHSKFTYSNICQYHQNLHPSIFLSNRKGIMEIVWTLTDWLVWFDSPPLCKYRCQQKPQFVKSTIWVSAEVTFSSCWARQPSKFVCGSPSSKQIYFYLKQIPIVNSEKLGELLKYIPFIAFKCSIGLILILSYCLFPISKGLRVGEEI